MNMRYWLRWLLVGCVCLSVLFSKIHIVSAADEFINVFPNGSSSAIDVRTSILINSSHRSIDEVEFVNGITQQSSVVLRNVHYPPSLYYNYCVRITSRTGVLAREGSKLELAIDGLSNSLYVKDMGMDTSFIMGNDWIYNSVIEFTFVDGSYKSYQTSKMLKFIPTRNDVSYFGFIVETNTLDKDLASVELRFLSNMDEFYSENGSPYGDFENDFNEFTWITGFKNSHMSINMKVPDKTDELLEDTNEKLDEQLGFFESIVLWFENIFNSITDLPNKLKAFFDNIVSSVVDLGSAIGNFFDELLTGILEGLKGLFVPNEDSITDIKDSFLSLMSDRFGALYDVVSLVTDYAGQFVASEQGYIDFPTIDIPLGSVNFAFGGWRVKCIPDGFAFLIDALKLMVSIACTFLFVNGLRARFEKVVSK